MGPKIHPPFTTLKNDPTHTELPPDPPELNPDGTPVVKDTPPPEILEHPPEPKPETKPENDEKADKAAKQKQAAESTEGSDTSNPHSDSSRRSAYNPLKDAGASRFQQDAELQHMTGAKLPENFGKVYDESRESLGQKNNPNSSPADHFQQGDRARFGPQTGSSNLIPQPEPQVYHQLLQERQFRGPMRDAPLYQKLQQQAQQNQELNLTKFTNERGEPLNKGEIMQLFRMRNEVEQRDKLKAILKHAVAKAQFEAGKKVQSVGSQTEKQGEQKTHLRKAEATTFNKIDSAMQKIAARVRHSSLANRFEKFLQKYFSGEKIVPELPEGTLARFAEKTEEEWNLFFASAKNLGSEELAEMGDFEKLAEALFRGTFTSTETGKNTLVADLAFLQEGEMEESKYSKFLLNNKDVAEALKDLKPGDRLSAEILKKIDPEFNFVKLMHTVQSGEMSDEQRADVLKAYKRGQSDASQKMLESALLGHREENKKDEKKELPFIFAGNQFDKKERFRDNHRLFMYILYAIGTFSTAMILYLVLRAVL